MSYSNIVRNIITTCTLSLFLTLSACGKHLGESSQTGQGELFIQAQFSGPSAKLTLPTIQTSVLSDEGDLSIVNSGLCVLEHASAENITKAMTINNGFGSTYFSTISSGEWAVSINLLSSAGNILYSGTGNITVLDGDITVSTISMTRQNGDSAILVQLPIIDIQAGPNTSRFIRADGSLWETGLNPSLPSANSTETWLNTLDQVVDIDSSILGTLAVKSDGSIWAFGNASNGALGSGSTGTLSTWTQVGTGARKVALSQSNGFYISQSHLLYGTGKQDGLGNGISSDITNFTQLALSNVKDVVTNHQSTLVLTLSDKLYVVGKNATYGTLGINNGTDINAWTFVTDNVRAIDMGHRNAFFVTHDNELYVTGFNSYGNLGLGSTSHVSEWTLSRSDVKQVWADQTNTYVLTTDDSFYGVGQNYGGQLGKGSTDSSMHSSWVDMTSTLVNAKKLAGGDNSLLFLDSDGNLKFLGDSSNGQSGISGTETFLHTVDVD